MRALRFSTLVVAVFLVVLLARVVHRQNDLREEPTHVDEPSSKKSTHHDGILPSSSVPNDQALHHHNSKKDSANNASKAQESSSQNSTSIPDDKSTSVFSHNTPHSLYRRGFIMMHILKAGGNTVEQHLRDVGWNQQHNNHSIYQAGLGYVWMEQDADIAWYHNFTDNVYLQDKFRGEHTNTLPSWQEFPPTRLVFSHWLGPRTLRLHGVRVGFFRQRSPHGNLTGRCGGNAAMTNFSHFVQHTTTPHLTWLSYRLAILQAGDNRQHLYYPHQLVIECPDNIPNCITARAIHAAWRLFKHTTWRIVGSGPSIYRPICSSACCCIKHDAADKPICNWKRWKHGRRRRRLTKMSLWPIRAVIGRVPNTIRLPRPSRCGNEKDTWRNSLATRRVAGDWSMRVWYTRRRCIIVFLLALAHVQGLVQ